MEAFPKTTDGIYAYVNAIKNAEGATGKFKASFEGLGAAIKANPVGAAIAGITVLIAVIKKVDSIIDETHDSTEELLTKRKEISESLSDINGDIESINTRLSELEDKEKSITDPQDKANLKEQIELLPMM